MIRFATRDTRAHDTESTEVHEPPPAPGRLVLLAADAASPAARRLHRFSDVAAAGEFICFWYPPDKRRGLIAFWSLPEAPLDAAAEALVIIRDGRDETLVYPFSFLDVPSAMAFAARECSRGIDPALISIQYAAAVSIEARPNDAEDVFLTPPTPPLRQRPALVPRPETRWSYRIDTPAVSDEPGLLPDDLVERVLNVLRLRRWGRLPSPFAGFGSPPGRF